MLSQHLNDMSMIER